MDPFEAQACCHALSNGRRMALLLSLRSSPTGATPTLLSALIDLEPAQVSEQLAILHDAKLVIKQRAGKHTIFYINEHQMSELATFLTLSTKE